MVPARVIFLAECDCNEHAAACHFDEIKGLGVCDNCEADTAGDFCELCSPGYHRNPSNQNPRINMTGLDTGTCSGKITTLITLKTCDVISLPSYQDVWCLAAMDTDTS